MNGMYLSDSLENYAKPAASTPTIKLHSLKLCEDPDLTPSLVNDPHILNTGRSYKRQGHAPLKHFVGFPVQWWKARIIMVA